MDIFAPKISLLKPAEDSVIARQLAFFKRCVRAVVVVGMLALLPVGVAHAQYNASLRGTVTDPTGAVIPGATLTLVDTDTNATQIAKSNAAGFYTFNALPPAPYRLTVSRSGFKTNVLAHVQIIPEQANQLNVKLQIGTVQQTVTVSAVSRALPATPTLSTTINSTQIQHMPSLNRDIFQLAQLTPGTLDIAAQGSGGGTYDLPGNEGPGGAAGGSSGIFQTENVPQLQSNGGQSDTNGISVDGISTESAVWGGASVITPSEDSVQSVHVISNSYNAEDGRFTGADIQVLTKSGTNTVHGSAFFKASRPGLNAYQRWNGVGSNTTGPDANPDGTPTTPAQRAAIRGVNRYTARFNNFGGSLGGPLWKNKLFAFFNVEASPLSSSTTAQGWYDTSQFDSLTGVAPIATKYLTFPGEGVASGATLIARNCASIGLTEGGNCNTESGGLDVGSPLTTGVGKQDLTYGGNSSTPGVGGGLDGIPDIAYFNTVNPTTTSQAQYNGRLDGQLTSKDRLTFAIYWVPVSTTDYQGPTRAANLWHHSQVNDAFSLIWNHIFSPTLLNQARANAAGWRFNEVASNPQEPFGLPADTIEDIGGASVQSFGAPNPAVYDQWTYQYNDVLTKVLKRQNIKAGGSLTHLQYLNDAVGPARPNFNFDNLWDFANDAPFFESGTFNPATGVPLDNRQDDREDIWGFFVQDDYKMRPNLTITAGLRWSYFAPYYSKENNLAVVQLGSGANALSGMSIRVGGNLATAGKNDWGPQLGFAWQPSNEHGNFVLRGGFGINYNQNEIAILANGFGNPPNLTSASYTCPYPYTSNPTCAGTGILYETATSTSSLFGYAPNPATVTGFSSANLPLTGEAFVTGFPAHTKNIANYHYSLETDLQLPYNSVFTLGYQGSLMRHLLIQDDWLAIAAQRGLAMNPRVNFLDYYANSANGNYNAMLTTLTHNFAHNFQAEAQYTWSKTMDEGSGPYEEDPYPYDTHAAYGRADYNVANAIKLFGLWQPNFFKANTWEEKVAGGWTISGIWNVDSGFPWNPVYQTTGIYFQGSGYGAIRPSAYLGGAGTNTSDEAFEGKGPGGTNPNYGGDGTKFFAPPTYTLAPAFPATAPGPAPGIARNSLNGPGYNDFDGSLTKAFGLPNNKILGENAMISLEANAYNLFNKTNINTGCMDTTLGSVNPNGTIASVNSDFGVACGGLGSRTVQLQARFSF